MAIYRLIQKGAYGPEDIRVLVQAYETALHALRLVDRCDPLTEVVASKVIQIWGTGERDPHRIAAGAFNGLDAGGEQSDAASSSM